MKIILVPGFWFDSSSWDLVTPLLRDAGHEVTALTLPGLESVDTDRSGIGLAEHVAAIVEQVDASGGPVALVGSSFAGKLVQIVTDQRPDSIALAVYVDAFPKPVGADPDDEPAGADIAFSWDELTTDEQRDLTEEQRSQIEQQAVPFPAKVVRDGWVMSDERRYATPSLVVATGFSAADLEQWRADYPEIGPELDAHDDLSFVYLSTSHWPQLTKPHELVDILRDALG